MWHLALAVFAIAVLGTVGYARSIERRARKRRLSPDGIVPGAEAIAHERKDAPGVLLLHGAGDTPQVLSELARYLYDRGYAVRVPLLSGHGRALSAFAAVTSASWRGDAARAYADIQADHRSVSIVGISMGGALAASLAARERRIEALVLLVPYLAMPVAVRAASVTSRAWGWLCPYFMSGGERSIHDPVAAAGGLGYGVFTPNALRALHEIAGDGWNALPAISAPTLAIHSREDNRISVSNAEGAFARLGSTDKKLAWIEGAGHVITVDYGHERVFELTAEWLDYHTGRVSTEAARAKGPSQTADPSRRAR